MSGKIAAFMILSASLILGGCNSGTTYGTGVSHEEQTLKSMYNMLSIRPEKPPVIDYSARPDLVMPADGQSLPAPADETAVADGQWPVNPEQRLAAIRDGAPEVDDRSGALPVEAGGNKLVAIQRRSGSASEYDNLDRGPTAKDFVNGGSEEVRRKREQGLARAIAGTGKENGHRDFGAGF